MCTTTPTATITTTTTFTDYCYHPTTATAPRRIETSSEPPPLPPQGSQVLGNYVRMALERLRDGSWMPVNEIMTLNVPFFFYFS